MVSEELRAAAVVRRHALTAEEATDLLSMLGLADIARLRWSRTIDLGAGGTVRIELDVDLLVLGDTEIAFLRVLLTAVREFLGGLR